MSWVPAPTVIDEHERLRRLLRLGVGEGQRHDVLDTITSLAAAMLKSPISLVSLVEEHRQFFLSRFGLDASATPRPESFCGHCVSMREALVVADARSDLRFVENPLVVGHPHVRAYLGVPLFAGPGQSAVGTLCVIDTTPRGWSVEERQQVERLAHLVEDYLESLSVRRAWDDSPLSMVVLDAEGRCLRANPAFARFVGRPAADLVERPLTAFVVSGDRSVLQAMVSHAATKRESPTRRELRYVRLTGEVVNGGTSLAPIMDVAGQSICIIRDISLERRMTARSGVAAEVRRELDAPLMRARALVQSLHGDVTEPLSLASLEGVQRMLDEFGGLLDARIGDIGARVRAEAELDASAQRLRSLLENVLGPLLVLDDRGRIVDANVAALQVLGWRYEDLVGTSMRNVMPLFTDAVCRRWFEVAAGDPSTRDASMEAATFCRTDGGELRMELRLMSMDWNGPGRLVVIAQDVTAAWTREASLLQEREALASQVRTDAETVSELLQVESHLKASLEEKETLLKEIHHRVKNNLQMVSSLLTLQMDQMPEGRARMLLAESVQRVRSMALIHQHLYGSVSLERIDIGAYTRSLAETLRLSLAPSARLKMVVPEVEVTADRAVPVGLILNELLTNAFKYGAMDSARVKALQPAEDPWCVLVEIREESRRLILSVRDRGPGLPEGFALTGHPSLGLQLVTTLVRQLRGQVRAYSDAGAVFELSFALDPRPVP